ncbi:hypothetical protein KKH18_05710 [bacterium]|nr:hypothetical protein [bacterium]
MIFSKRDNPPEVPESQSVEGQGWRLDIVKSSDTGPFYPQIKEQSDEQSYRFFAGRIPGQKPTDDLPSGFSINNGDITAWEFPQGEPEGSWLALKFDRKRDIVSITCDLWLLQRWYYAEIDGKWFFTNSLNFLRDVTGNRLRVERRAIPYMLLFGYMPGSVTPIQNVRSIVPGEVVSIDRGRLFNTIRKRVPVKRVSISPEGPSPSQNECDNAAESILNSLRQAVRLELEKIDSIVVPLSGGMDSRFLLGCAMEVLPHDRITTYTYGHPRTFDFKFGVGMAKELGLHCVPLPMDRRPLEEIIKDGFKDAEGMTFVLPNSPMGSIREAALPEGSFVLSGYIGDAVYGSHDIEDNDPNHNTDEFLIEKAMAWAAGGYYNEVLPLLTSTDWDEMDFRGDLRKTPGETLPEKYERWHYEVHCVNRVNFALQKYRNRAFYLAPFIHRNVWEIAYNLPQRLRHSELAFFLAMEQGFPKLYRYPSARNAGFSVEMKHQWIKKIRRGLQRAMVRFDDSIWRTTGRFAYYSPNQNYGHRRELNQPMYHTGVHKCIEDLLSISILNPLELKRFRQRYDRRQGVSTHTIRALFTIREWERQFGDLR